MVIRVKFRDAATAERVEEALGRLRAAGFPATPTFPGAKRRSLAQVFNLAGGDDAGVERMRDLLRPDSDGVEYVERSVMRALVEK